MLADAAVFLISVIFETLCTLFLVRCLMQLFKCPFANPVGQLVITLTDFAVKPLRRVLPSINKLDTATLLLALLSQLLLYVLIHTLIGRSIDANTVGLSFLGFARALLNIFFYTILVQAILSWVNPYTPVAGVLNALTKPILTPIRKLVPIINGFDFSSFIALILIQLVQFSVINHLFKHLGGA